MFDVVGGAVPGVQTAVRGEPDQRRHLSIMQILLQPPQQDLRVEGKLPNHQELQLRPESPSAGSDLQLECESSFVLNTKHRSTTKCKEDTVQTH